jgi:hypothetical protein
VSGFRIQEVRLKPEQWSRLAKQGLRAIEHAKMTHGGDASDVDHIPTELGYQCLQCGARFPLQEPS